MFNAKKLLTITSLVALSLGSASFANAQSRGERVEMGNPNIQAYKKTTEFKTVTTAVPSELLIYDLNGNGILEAEEVGEKLFYQFDRDGNQVLDNIEFNRALDLKFAPVEKTRVVTVAIDYNNNSIVDSQEVTQEVVMQRTGLDRFSTRSDGGVTPREFIGKTVLELDLNRSGVVELHEWKRAYMERQAPLAADNIIYNQ